MKLKSSVAFLLRRWCRLSAIANPWRLALLPILLGWPMLALAQEQTTPSDPGSVTMIPTQVDLPRDLSPWGMFTTADSIVKAVLIGLVIASFVTWTVWLAKTIELFI